MVYGGLMKSRSINLVSALHPHQMMVGMRFHHWQTFLLLLRLPSQLLALLPPEPLSQLPGLLHLRLLALLRSTAQFHRGWVSSVPEVSEFHRVLALVLLA